MTERSRRRFWTCLAVISAAVVTVCLALLFWPSGSPEPDGTIDFDALQARNPEIYAWLRIPEAGINHPVLQRQGASNEEEDEFYLNRDLDGNPSEAGSLFTQYRYNTMDFSDPVTVIYGHSREDGSMFGRLQMWCQEKGLGETFTIYQPGRQLTYRVFAGIPYDNSHVLYYHNFHDEQVYTEFFEDVFATRSLSAVLDPDAVPSYGTQVVILATCLKGDETRRYLVMGALTEDASVSS